MSDERKDLNKNKDFNGAIELTEEQLSKVDGGFINIGNKVNSIFDKNGNKTNIPTKSC